MAGQNKLEFPHQIRIKNNDSSPDYVIAMDLSNKGVVRLEDRLDVDPNSVKSTRALQRVGNQLHDSYHATVVFDTQNALEAFNSHPLRGESGADKTLQMKLIYAKAAVLRVRERLVREWETIPVGEGA